MSQEIKTDMPKQDLRKSKRLSSFVWILVLWAFVYLISGLDGISWKRAFAGVALDFGLWPVTALLLLAIFFPNREIEIIFRWSAFLIFSSGCLLLLVLDMSHMNEAMSTLITNIIHWTVVGIALSYVAIKTVRKSQSK